VQHSSCCFYFRLPTGFGKSPVAIAAALTLGTSYICTSTKDLQSQYARDFPFLKVAKGKNNFICAVKEEMALTDVDQDVFQIVRMNATIQRQTMVYA
jgi:Rad3-related DNA helicase